MMFKGQVNRLWGLLERSEEAGGAAWLRPTALTLTAAHCCAGPWPGGFPLSPGAPASNLETKLTLRGQQATH